MAVFEGAERRHGKRQDGIGKRQDQRQRQGQAHRPPPPHQPQDQRQHQKDVGMRQRLQQDGENLRGNEKHPHS